MFETQRVLISRHGADADHDPLHHVPAVMIGLPSVGEALQMYLDTGKLMQTSQVTHIGHDGNDLVVDTLNSRYRLELAS